MCFLLYFYSPRPLFVLGVGLVRVVLGVRRIREAEKPSDNNEVQEMLGIHLLATFDFDCAPIFQRAFYRDR